MNLRPMEIPKVTHGPLRLCHPIAELPRHGDWRLLTAGCHNGQLDKSQSPVREVRRNNLLTAKTSTATLIEHHSTSHAGLSSTLVAENEVVVPAQPKTWAQWAATLLSELTGGIMSQSTRTEGGFFIQKRRAPRPRRGRLLTH